MTFKPTSVPTKNLLASITSGSLSFRLNNIKGWNGSNLTAADFGSQGYVVFRDAARTKLEIMEFDPSTIASNDIVITKRGLQFDGNLLTEDVARKLSWTKGDTFVDLGTDAPQLWQWLKEYIDGIAIAGAPDSSTSTKGLVKMSSAPTVPGNPIAFSGEGPKIDAMAGGGDFGTPSGTNKFVTEDYLDVLPTPQVVVFSTPATYFGDSTTRYDITNPSGSTYRYTYDFGTSPSHTSSNPSIGAKLDIRAQNFAANNQGFFTVTGSGANYFEVTNGSGVVESDKTIGTGYIAIATTWTKDAGLKYIIVEGVGAGATSSSISSGGGGGYFRKLILAANLGATETVTIGATGSPGKNTSFGAHCTGNGGTRPAGGTATGGDINIPGGNGTNSGSGGTGGNYGMGGNSVLGFAATDGNNAIGYGAGAAGANGSSSNPNGTNGVVIVTEYY